MGEKGNLLDTGEEIFANLAEQGPQFWLDFERYKLTRARSPQTDVVVEQRVHTQDRPPQPPGPPTAG
jgi:hypothetical protein